MILGFWIGLESLCWAKTAPLPPTQWFFYSDKFETMCSMTGGSTVSNDLLNAFDFWDTNETE